MIDSLSPEKAGVGGSTPSLATIFFKDLRIPYPDSLRTIANKTKRKMFYCTNLLTAPPLDAATQERTAGKNPA
jgi:hypothetical protein